MIIFEAFWMPYTTRNVSGLWRKVSRPLHPHPFPQHPSHLCTDSCGWRTWGATVPDHPHFGECRGHSRAECLPAPPHSVPCPAGTRRYCLSLSPGPGSSASGEGLPPSCRHGEIVPVPVGDNSSPGSPAQPTRATSGLPLQLGVGCASLLDLTAKSREMNTVGQPGLSTAPCPSQPG